MPAIAILTFGRFTLCCEEQEIALPGRQGDTLCKALLCQPGRQAESGWLLEHLWPEAEGDLAITYLHNAAWTLRQSLPAGMLLTHKATQSYQLVGQDQLWVDADAALARIAEADTLGRATAEALPRLEQAVQYVRRGRFLAGVEETWVQARRIHIETMKERAFTWLVEAYRKQGKLPQAEALLSEALAEDPANENVLCHLMQTLHEEGMTHQALRAYEEFAKSLKKAGLEPAEMTTALYRHLKRAPRGLALSALQTTPRHDERGPFPPALQEAAGSSALVHEEWPPQQTQPLLLFPNGLSRSAWASRNHHRMLDLLSATPGSLFDGQDLGAWFALSASDLGALLERGWSVEALLEVLQMILPVVKAMPMMTRRAFLHAGVATALLGGLPLLDSQQISEEESTQLCLALGQSIQTSWKLFLSTENKVMLATGQALLALVQQTHPLLYSAVRPLLYTGAYSLIGIALHLQERDREALQAYQSSYIAALSSGDPWYVAQSLICQSDSYHMLGHYDQAIQKIEEALRLLDHPTNEAQRRAKAHLLTCWADNAMMLADHRTAQEKLEAAAVYLDQLSANEEFDRAGWLQLAGKYSLLTRDYATAIRSFEQALEELPASWILRRAMTAIGLAMAYARAKERESSLSVGENVIPLVGTINATMTNRWLTEYLQEDLLGHFPTDTRVQTFVTDTYRRLPQLATIPPGRR